MKGVLCTLVALVLSPILVTANEVEIVYIDISLRIPVANGPLEPEDG